MGRLQRLVITRYRHFQLFFIERSRTRRCLNKVERRGPKRLVAPCTSLRQAALAGKILRITRRNGGRLGSTQAYSIYNQVDMAQIEPYLSLLNVAQNLRESPKVAPRSNNEIRFADTPVSAATIT